MLTTDLCGIKLKNPIIAASGTFGFGQEFEKYFDLSELGGISCKGLTLNAKDGNEGQRIYETAAGLMNSIGLQNPSVSGFIQDYFPAMQAYKTEIIVNLGGNTLQQYVEGVKLLEPLPINFIELNISCPNVKEGGMAFGITCDSAETVIKAVRAYTTKKLIVKLSPNAENIQQMAITCEKAGADALSLVNTFSALAIDIYKRKPIFNNVIAGLSGPAIKPIALRMVRDVYQVVKIPIIGMGGIASWSDAIEFMMAGATAVQVGTANFLNPTIMLDIIHGIQQFMVDQKIQFLEEIRGII